MNTVKMMAVIAVVFLAGCKPAPLNPEARNAETEKKTEAAPIPTITQPEKVAVEFVHPSFFGARLEIRTEEGTAVSVLPDHAVPGNPDFEVAFPSGMTKGFQVVVRLKNGNIHYEKATMSMRHVVLSMVAASSICEGRPSLLVVGSESPKGSGNRFYEDGLYGESHTPKGPGCLPYGIRVF